MFFFVIHAGQRQIGLKEIRVGGLGRFESLACLDGFAVPQFEIGQQVLQGRAGLVLRKLRKPLNALLGLPLGKIAVGKKLRGANVVGLVAQDLLGVGAGARRSPARFSERRPVAGVPGNGLPGAPGRRPSASP